MVGTEVSPGSLRISLTSSQHTKYNDYKENCKGIRVFFSTKAISNITQTGVICPLLAPLPELIAPAVPAVDKAAALGAAETASGVALKYAVGGELVNQGFQFKRVRMKTSRVNLPLSNFDLIDEAKGLRAKYFRVFSRNRLPKIPGNQEMGIINLDDDVGRGTN